MAAEMRSGNLSTLDEGYPENIEILPNFQQVDNADSKDNAYVKGVNTAKMATELDFQENNEDQMRDKALMKAGLQLTEVSKGESIEGVIYSDSSNMNQESSMARSSITKPKSTWTRINRMDSGLGGISKALMLPTLGSRIPTSNLEEGKAEGYDTRVVKRGKVGNGGDINDDISAGVEIHPCREQ